VKTVRPQHGGRWPGKDALRIVTRPDFDGVVCAVLLFEVETITAPVKWVEPGDMQRGQVAVRAEDIIANLPFHPNCALWFDHHVTNRIGQPFKGDFRVTPSAARVVFDFYRGRYPRDYRELVRETDRIDSADLTLAEIQRPENYPYVLLSMTVVNTDPADETYWNHLVGLLRKAEIAAVMEDPLVARRCGAVREQNNAYRELLLRHTRMEGHVALTDVRSVANLPAGNRFLVYSLFPESIVNVRIRRDPARSANVSLSVGHSIVNRQCRVNVGRLLSRFGGGGHHGAGACRFPAAMLEIYLPQILEILQANRDPEADAENSP
jgi:hypothetical protein